MVRRRYPGKFTFTHNATGSNPGGGLIKDTTEAFLRDNSFARIFHRGIGAEEKDTKCVFCSVADVKSIRKESPVNSGFTGFHCAPLS